MADEKEHSGSGDAPRGPTETTPSLCERAELLQYFEHIASPAARHKVIAAARKASSVSPFHDNSEAE